MRSKTLSVSTLSIGMAPTALASTLISPTGLSQGPAPTVYPAVAVAIDLSTVTSTTDDDVTAATATRKRSIAKHTAHPAGGRCRKNPVERCSAFHSDTLWCLRGLRDADQSNCPEPSVSLTQRAKYLFFPRKSKEFGRGEQRRRRRRSCSAKRRFATFSERRQHEARKAAEKTGFEMPDAEIGPGISLRAQSLRA